MQRFDLKQKDKLLKHLHHVKLSLDDSDILNILYLLCELRKPPSLSIVDPLVIKAFREKELYTKYLKESLHNTTHQVIYFPLIYGKHWSLLVFLPSLKGYLHFDSIEGYHRSHVSFMLSRLDPDRVYHPIVCSRNIPEQRSDWECGYFLLMSSYIFIDMKLETLCDEEMLRLYVNRHIPSLNENNVFRFAKKLHTIIAEL